jgi:hypothetical protein
MTDLVYYLVPSVIKVKITLGVELKDLLEKE